MSYNIENIFPTPIYYSFFKDDTFFSVQNEIKTYLLTNKFDESNASTYYITTNTFKEDIIREQNFLNLEKEIDKHIKNYCKELNFEYTNYTRQSWITLLKEGQRIDSHNHGYVHMSGVYYYSGEENDARSSICYYNSHYHWAHSAIPGKILLFPGWLTHGVWFNNSKNSRISLAFNITFCN
jgi:hypothetical protein